MELDYWILRNTYLSTRVLCTIMSFSPNFDQSTQLLALRADLFRVLFSFKPNESNRVSRGCPDPLFDTIHRLIKDTTGSCSGSLSRRECMLGMSVQLETLQEFQSADCQNPISEREVTRTEDVHLPSWKISFVRLWWSLLQVLWCFLWYDIWCIWWYWLDWNYLAAKMPREILQVSFTEFTVFSSCSFKLSSSASSSLMSHLLPVFLLLW